MKFTALVVVGDNNGHVGVGLGKSTEIPDAIRKGKEDATKNLITVPLDENNSITHDFVGKFGSAEVPGSNPRRREDGGSPHGNRSFRRHREGNPPRLCRHWR